MDWPNEPYVKVYTRETDDDLLLSWDARSVWNALLQKFDRSGCVDTKRGARGIAALIRAPLEVVERSLPELLADGRLQERRVNGAIVGYLAPNFQAAQEASKSNRARQAESRARRRDTAERQAKEPIQESFGDPTFRLAIVPEHTLCHAETSTDALTSADPDPDPDPVRATRAGARAIPHTQVLESLPEAWTPEPTPENTKAASEATARGVVGDFELRKFRERARSAGWHVVDWNARWREWLLKAHPTAAPVREALTQSDRARTAQAARDRERTELAEQRQRAEEAREDVRRAAKEAIATGFRLPADGGTTTR